MHTSTLRVLGRTKGGAGSGLFDLLAQLVQSCAHDQLRGRRLDHPRHVEARIDGELVQHLGFAVAQVLEGVGPHQRLRNVSRIYIDRSRPKK